MCVCVCACVFCWGCDSINLTMWQESWEWVPSCSIKVKNCRHSLSCLSSSDVPVSYTLFIPFLEGELFFWLVCPHSCRRLFLRSWQSAVTVVLFIVSSCWWCFCPTVTCFSFIVSSSSFFIVHQMHEGKCVMQPLGTVRLESGRSRVRILLVPGFFRGRVIPVTKKLPLKCLPCQAPGIIGSVLGLVGPVSVYCDWVRWKVGSATSISVWQHVKLSKQIHPWDTLACCLDVKLPTTNFGHKVVLHLPLQLSTLTGGLPPRLPAKAEGAQAADRWLWHTCPHFV